MFPFTSLHRRRQTYPLAPHPLKDSCISPSIRDQSELTLPLLWMWTCVHAVLLLDTLWYSINIFRWRYRLARHYSVLAQMKVLFAQMLYHLKVLHECTLHKHPPSRIHATQRISGAMRTHWLKTTLRGAHNQLWCDWLMRAGVSCPIISRAFHLGTSQAPG